MPGLTSGTAPNVVKTALDSVFESEYDREQEPQEVLATDPLFFKQDTTDKSAEITEEFQGPGEFAEHVESEEIEQATIRSDNKKTHSVANYKKQLKIPVEFYEDDQHALVDRSIRQMGLRGRTTRDKNAYANAYGDAFSGVTTSDSTALIADSHTALDGSTIDNKETGSLTGDNLETLIKKLRLQKAQDGELGGHNAAGLLVPPALFPDAIELAESELKPNVTDNNLNYISRIYPGMVVGTSAYLDSDWASNSNADTSYYAVSRNHSIFRWVRKPLTTSLVDYSYDDQDRYVYKARYREVVSAISWEGIVGSDGSA